MVRSPSLQESPLLDGLSVRQRELFGGLMEPQHFDEATLIFEQGGIARYLYLLESGKVIIRYKPYDGPPLQVAEISPGEVFGWSAVLNRVAYTSSAMAMEDSLAYRINIDNLKKLCASYPQSSVTLLERLAQLANVRAPNAHQEVIAILQSGLAA